MSEKCLFYMPDYLYSEGIPVVVVSGRVVSEGGVSEKNLILNLRNISGRTIVSLSMRALLLNEAGVIESTIELYYQNVHAQDGKDFGDKIHFPVPPVGFSNITLMFVGALFENGETLNFETYLLDTVPTPKLISVGLKDDKLKKLYRQKFGENANKEYTTYKDLWICTCGAIHKNNMGFCTGCGLSREVLENFSLDELKEKVSNSGSSYVPDDTYHKQLQAGVTSNMMVDYSALNEARSDMEKGLDLEAEYQKACSIMTQDDSYSGLYDAQSSFKKLGNYKDSAYYVGVLESRLDYISKQNAEIDRKKKIVKILSIAIPIAVVLIVLIILAQKEDERREERERELTEYTTEAITEYEYTTAEEIVTEEVTESSRTFSDSDFNWQTFSCDFTDRDGYKIHENIKVSGWMRPEEDADMLKAAWDEVSNGEEFEANPSEMGFHDGEVYTTSTQVQTSTKTEWFDWTDVVYAVGYLEVENKTEGFSFSESRDYTYTVGFGNDNLASIKMYYTEPKVLYAGYNYDMQWHDIRPKMIRDDWGPVPFIIALPIKKSPNNPSGSPDPSSVQFYFGNDDNSADHDIFYLKKNWDD